MSEAVGLIWKYGDALWGGLAVTARLFLIVSLTGLLLGIALGFLRHRYRGIVAGLIKAVGLVVSGIPILVLLYWAHYPAQRLLGVVVPPFVTAACVLAAVNVVVVAAIVAEALDDFPSQYLLAARVCGVPAGRAFFYIELPLLGRNLIPALLPVQVAILHGTLFASLISVEEIFRVAQRINAIEYKPIEIYSSLAVFFLVISVPVELLARYLRRRYTRDTAER